MFGASKKTGVGIIFKAMKKFQKKAQNNWGIEH